MGFEVRIGRVYLTRWKNVEGSNIKGRLAVSVLRICTGVRLLESERSNDTSISSHLPEYRCLVSSRAVSRW